MGAVNNLNNVAKTMTMIQAIIATICCVVGMGFAYWYFSKEQTYIKTYATVSEMIEDCEAVQRSSKKRSRTDFLCKLRVEYNFKGVTYESVLETDSSKKYYKGSKLAIGVHKDNPANIEMWTASNKTIGLGISALCSCAFIVAWGRYLISSKVKRGGSAILAMDTLSAIRD